MEAEVREILEKNAEILKDLSKYDIKVLFQAIAVQDTEKVNLVLQKNMFAGLSDSAYLKLKADGVEALKALGDITEKRKNLAQSLVYAISKSLAEKVVKFLDG